MNHHATVDFWECYAELPEAVQRVADRHYALLRSNPRHPSLRFKKVGRLWSARVGSGYRALAAEASDGLVWFWIGTQDTNDFWQTSETAVVGPFLDLDEAADGVGGNRRTTDDADTRGLFELRSVPISTIRGSL